ncbi:MAG: precorrin-8X methylmutase [Actinomycetota bacterium]
MTRVVHEIEAESYRILRARIDTHAYPPLTRAVIERVIHASADIGYAADIVCDEVSLANGLAALQAGAPIVADVRMVAAGITGRAARCYLPDVQEGRASEVGPSNVTSRVKVEGPTSRTRSAAAMRLAFEDVGPGAVWVIGCAPTALAELIELDVRPALVIGLPVGFVGAVEAKAALRKSGLPAVSNVTERGGSAVAAAAVNALIYLLEDER